ncbi:transcriptional regulator, TetR family [Fulvimarina manganoxydans]|uniref:Transcriptional regulator, TetR family n=1 Tax=Fulvimarina manganoxydans TaxID=937218 RepID=A0A1W2E993_9HYPH|nr:TetR/AcrR family transcriptional regulator [Fulvimarina manganoxydans]SMD06350.1 transcriptional regulator, TetR family [Fulvimarina manganoxydans]
MSFASTAQARINQAAMRLFAEKGGNQINVSELAQAAGVARGTIYNNGVEPDRLFEEVVAGLASEMHARIALASQDIADPAIAVANGIRHFVRRAHEDPVWGRFILRFAFSSNLLRTMFESQPSVDLMKGLKAGRFQFQPDQASSVLAMIGGTGVAAMLLVLDGHKTWREAGSNAAELVLRALGLEAAEARAIAANDLPPLPES